MTVIRQLGTSVILYSWLPAGAATTSAPGIQSALETLGVGFRSPAEMAAGQA